MEKMVNGKIIVRDLSLSHLEEVTAIEERSFPNPWPAYWFISTIRADVLTWGAFSGRKLIGYLIAIPGKDMIHLANIAIDNPYRRQGIARLLMKRLYVYARRHHQSRITLEVRRSNRSAIALYEREGFAQVAVEQGYYRGEEDALIFNLELR